MGLLSFLHIRLFACVQQISFFVAIFLLQLKLVKYRYLEAGDLILKNKQNLHAPLYFFSKVGREILVADSHLDTQGVEIVGLRILLQHLFRCWG